MFRQCVSISLVISFIALAVSGMMMIFLNSFAFQLQMHPVHKVFGIIMVVSGCLHLSLNFTPVTRYLKNKAVLALGVFLSLALVFLFVVGMNKPIDQDNIKKIEQVMSEMGGK